MGLNQINIKERMEHYNVSGLSITLIDNVRISVEEYYGLLQAGTNKKVNDHSIFNACSISKFLTGMLVLDLTEQGILDLDEDVNNKLKTWKIPNNERTKSKKVTLRNLLSHQSGIVDPVGSFTEYNSFAGIPSMVELLEGRTSYCSVPIEVKYTPESDFQYSDAGFCIIQQLIEDVTEKPFKQIMNERIFQPLNMKRSTFEITISEEKMEYFSCGHNKNGEVVDSLYPIYPYPAASGLRTTSSDLALLVIELMNALKGQSKIDLSKNIIKEMISSQGCKNWTGLGVFLDDSGQKVEISSLGWGVGFQCMLAAQPYSGTGAVIMTNTDLGVHQLKGIIGEIYHSLSS